MLVEFRYFLFTFCLCLLLERFDRIDALLLMFVNEIDGAERFRIMTGLILQAGLLGAKGEVVWLGLNHPADALEAQLRRGRELIGELLRQYSVRMRLCIAIEQRDRAGAIVAPGHGVGERDSVVFGGILVVRGGQAIDGRLACTHPRQDAPIFAFEIRRRLFI